MRQIVLDTETTGLDPKQGHRVIEIGCIELVDRKITGKNFQAYINPEREVDPGAANISGLTLSFLLDKPKFRDIVHDFLYFVEDSELIIHNAPFDLGFINHELSLMNHPSPKLDAKLSVIDTLQMARKLHPGQKNNLDALCKRYNVDNTHREFHGALLDSELLAKVYLAMTAGQTSILFGEETKGGSGNHEFSVKEIQRTKKTRIIYANLDELAAHKEMIR